MVSAEALEEQLRMLVKCTGQESHQGCGVDQLSSHIRPEQFVVGEQRVQAAVEIGYERVSCC